jgi:hypothetical protein
MGTRQMLINQLMGLRLYVHRKFSLHREGDTVYLAYGIGPEVLAVSVHELNAQNDDAGNQLDR